MAQKTQTGLCINLDGWDGKGDGREVQKGGASCIPMTDSCSGLTENKILSSNYPSLKNKLKKKKNLCDFPRGPVARNLLAMQGTWVRPLVQEDTT